MDSVPDDIDSRAPRLLVSARYAPPEPEPAGRADRNSPGHPESRSAIEPSRTESLPTRIAGSLDPQQGPIPLEPCGPLRADVTGDSRQEVSVFDVRPTVPVSVQLRGAEQSRARRYHGTRDNVRRQRHEQHADRHHGESSAPPSTRYDVATPYGRCPGQEHGATVGVYVVRRDGWRPPSRPCGRAARTLEGASVMMAC